MGELDGGAETLAANVAASRGRRGAAWTLITPANHYPSRLPHLPGARVVKLVTPRLAPSRIGCAVVLLPGGLAESGPAVAGFEHLLYVLEGEVEVDGEALPAGGFAYLPASAAFTLRPGAAPARVFWCKRRHEPWPGLAAPGRIIGHRDDEPFADGGVPGFTRRELVPVDDPAFDLNLSLLAFDPGVGLANVEIHDEEHGLYMTRGSGHYHLDGEDHPVTRDDFIYMAPYCPQSFVASVTGAAEYLLYKDANRDGF